MPYCTPTAIATLAEEATKNAASAAKSLINSTSFTQGYYAQINALGGLQNFKGSFNAAAFQIGILCACAAAITCAFIALMRCCAKPIVYLIIFLTIVMLTAVNHKL